MGSKTVAAFLLARTLVWGCDSFGGSVAGNREGSDAVFRGRVSSIDNLGSTKAGLRRSAVHFRVSEVWKGPPDSEITLHNTAVWGGCYGFNFELGKEYVVFAHEEIVSRNLALVVNGKQIAFENWGDVLPYGKRILAANGGYTSEVRRSRNTISLLGRGTQLSRSDR
jgi:hypothetical protein